MRALFCFRGIIFNLLQIHFFQEVNSVYSILAGIIHTGNIEFMEKEVSHQTVTAIENDDLLHIGMFVLISPCAISWHFSASQNKCFDIDRAYTCICIRDIYQVQSMGYYWLLLLIETTVFPLN